MFETIIATNVSRQNLSVITRVLYEYLQRLLKIEEIYFLEIEENFLETIARRNNFSKG